MAETSVPRENSRDANDRVPTQLGVKKNSDSPPAQQRAGEVISTVEKRLSQMNTTLVDRGPSGKDAPKAQDAQPKGKPAETMRGTVMKEFQVEAVKSLEQAALDVMMAIDGYVKDKENAVDGLIQEGKKALISSLLKLFTESARREMENAQKADVPAAKGAPPARSQESIKKEIEKVGRQARKVLEPTDPAMEALGKLYISMNAPVDVSVTQAQNANTSDVNNISITINPEPKKEVGVPETVKAIPLPPEFPKDFELKVATIVDRIVVTNSQIEYLKVKENGAIKSSDPAESSRLSTLRRDLVDSLNLLLKTVSAQAGADEYAKDQFVATAAYIVQTTLTEKGARPVRFWKGEVRV